MEELKGHELHRWLFHNKNGQTIVFPQKSMPFAVFKKDAVWGGTCEVGGIKCRIRIRHNDEGEKGKRLEVWFPHEELGRELSFEEATLVGYIEIRGSFREGTGKCVFRWIDETARTKE